jgi:hypothetical protein
LAKGRVNTLPAERGPRKIFDFAGFISGALTCHEDRNEAGFLLNRKKINAVKEHCRIDF